MNRPDTKEPSRDCDRPIKWTSARIRKAMARPKPEGAIAKLCGSLPMPSINKTYALLRSIAGGADILEVESPRYHMDLEKRWILVNISQRDLDALMNIEAALEDLEPDVEHEEGHDAEETCEGEGADSDGEMDLVAAEKFGALRIDDQDAKRILAGYRDEARQAFQRHTGYQPRHWDDCPFSGKAARAAATAKVAAIPLHPNAKL